MLLTLDRVGGVSRRLQSSAEASPEKVISTELPGALRGTNSSGYKSYIKVMISNIMIYMRSVNE